LDGIQGLDAKVEMVLYVHRFIDNESGRQPVFFYPDL